MALLGQAALAMWWDMASAMRTEFEHWHSHQHFPERLGVPGFRRASRWRDSAGGEGFFVLYELEGFATLASPQYLARLNAPTPWSTRLMPHHRNMVRSQCHVWESGGAGVAGHALTIRLSPRAGEDAVLRARLREAIAALVANQGVAGLHLLRHQTPAIGATTEQKIRGNADGFADWVMFVTGYDPAALDALRDGALSDAALAGWGAQPGTVRGRYTLAQSAVPEDVRDVPVVNG